MALARQTWRVCQGPEYLQPSKRGGSGAGGNGKDLSFEQQRAAERAAAERAQLLHKRVVGQTSLTGPPNYNELPRNTDFRAVVKTSSVISLPNAAGEQQPVGYTYRPVVLETLRRDQRQRLDADEPGGNRPAQDGASLSCRPWSGSFRDHVTSDLGRLSIQPFHTGSSPSGETSFRRHARRSPTSLEDQVYETNAERTQPLQQVTEQAEHPTSVGSVNCPRSVEQAGSVDHSSATKFQSTTEFLSAVDQHGAIGDSGLNKLPNPSGHSLSPAALESLRRAQEQQPVVDEAGLDRLAGNGSSLATRNQQLAHIQRAQSCSDGHEPLPWPPDDKINPPNSRRTKGNP
ncbi:hypothetical protein PCASD_03269 [Puccinia coronata f. sp. avenae]|uniref:Uncharacterized protein n=1 Tax=Puccinia coronata f. sp. avenae TaxID=200324 RepID=A0A2N5S580_9BASI|nr:hypothetical protein PCASD_25069 [Puccinia coronata f. sp. avenae]PLW48212.1 hypothetical protein PCASD_03269 [Puccinia coronata f. sp. avenae]